eukprot:GDKJ01045160.1.p1 GENE.GDKJ01045160.1~~GDKJ01045160.1.p1  ORF type:complete len:257 (-),score=43.72 GDKJ01045160.1:127-897(-)
MSHFVEVEKISLAGIRSELVRLEESIIFALIERAQYALNSAVYTPGEILENSQYSFFEHFFRESEVIHAKMRRFTVPDEFPFFPENLAQPIVSTVAKLTRPWLPVRSVNRNRQLMKYYITHVLPLLCEHKDDTQYGSSTVHDIAVLQAISKRVHLGLYVAEAKIQEKREHFQRLVDTKDAAGVNDLLTNAEVEKRLLERVELKVATYASEITEIGIESKDYKIHPETVVKLYRDWIIPLTKEIEVEYIFKRLQKID